MTLTPLDAENVRFPIVMRGYDRRDVDDFRNRVADSLEEYINQLGALKARIGELESALGRYRENEELLKNSVVLAQRTADELAHAAHQRADAIVAAARAEAASISQELGRLRSEREQFEYAFYGLLQGFARRLELANPALQGSAAGQAAPGGQPGFEAAPAPVEQAAHGDLPAPGQVRKAPLLGELLPERLDANPPLRSNERDSDSRSFASALAAAATEEESRDEAPEGAFVQQLLLPNRSAANEPAVDPQRDEEPSPLF